MTNPTPRDSAQPGEEGNVSIQTGPASFISVSADLAPGVRAALGSKTGDSAQLPPLLPLPKVGPICHAMAADVHEYKVPRVGAHLVGVYDVALWSTDQLHAYAEAYAREALRAWAASVVPVVDLPKAHEAVRKVLQHHGLTKAGDGVVEADLIAAIGKLYAGAPPAHIPADVEAVTCLKCGHVNHIQEGKAPCQVSQAVAASSPAPEPEWTGEKVFVASVMGLDVYDTPDGEPATAVDAKGGQHA